MSDTPDRLGGWEYQELSPGTKPAQRCGAESKSGVSPDRLTTSCATVTRSSTTSTQGNRKCCGSGCHTRTPKSASPPASSGGEASSSPVTPRARGTLRLRSGSPTLWTRMMWSVLVEALDRAARPSLAATSPALTSAPALRTSSVEPLDASSSGSTEAPRTTPVTNSTPRASTRSRGWSLSLLAPPYEEISEDGRSSSTFNSNRQGTSGSPSSD
jgi:hypothetical protein